LFLRGHVRLGAMDLKAAGKAPGSCPESAATAQSQSGFSANAWHSTLSFPNLWRALRFEGKSDSQLALPDCASTDSQWILPRLRHRNRKHPLHACPCTSTRTARKYDNSRTQYFKYSNQGFSYIVPGRTIR